MNSAIAEKLDPPAALKGRDFSRAAKAQQNQQRLQPPDRISHLRLPFKEVLSDVLKVKPPEKESNPKPRKKSK